MQSDTVQERPLLDMSNELFNIKRIRIRSRLRETLYLEPMRVGESHIELKIEVYEDATGSFSSLVFAKEAFLIENACLTGVIEQEADRRAVVRLFVEDLFYDTTQVRTRTSLEAVEATIEIIHQQLLKSGEPIEYLSDLEGS